jgi:hypothetical protein
LLGKKDEAGNSTGDIVCSGGGRCGVDQKKGLKMKLHVFGFAGVMLVAMGGRVHTGPISTYPENPNGGANSFDYYVQTFMSPSDFTFLESVIVICLQKLEQFTPCRY